DQARPYVLLIQGGLAKATPVSLGARGEIGGEPWVEIVAGLAEGASVLGASTGLVRDGTPLRLPALPAAPAASAGTSAPVAGAIAVR
ncbi:MAG: efflux RND transporter periplasmic adaptor subunit, partial [Caldimonas sp.]